MSKTIAGAFVLAVGFLLVASGLTFGFSGDDYIHTYPSSDEWANNGSHDNTISDADGNLILENLTANELDTGTFTSEAISNNDSIDINNLVYEASDIEEENPERNIELIVRGLDDTNAIVESETYNLTNGRYSLGVDGLQETSYSSYQFVVNLESNDDTSPVLNSLRISGISYEDDQSNLLANGIGYLFIFIGFMMAIGGVYE